MVECLTDLIQFFVFLPVLVDFFFLGEAAFSQFAYLDLVVAGIEELAFELLDADAKDLDLLR